MRTRLLERESVLAPLMLAPVALYMVLLVGFPFLMAFVYSFSNVTVGNPEFHMVGFGNFAAVLRDPTFLKSLLNTCIFTFTSIAAVLVLSNILTELLMREFRFKWLVRFLIMLPWTAPIALGTIGYLWFLDSVFSPIDWLLRTWGLLGKPDTLLGPMSNLYWLGRPGLAMASVIVVHVWRLLPLATMIRIAGMNAIPREVVEAAQMDGAGYYRRLFPKIILPLLLPVISVTVIFSTLFTFTPLNAEAVKYNFDRMVDPAIASPRKSNIVMVKETKVIDEFTLAVTTNKPFAPLLAQLSSYNISIMSPTAAKKLGKNYSQAPAGTGPIKLESWTRGERTVLARNENYWGDKPALKEVIIKQGKDAVTQRQQVETGDADIAMQLDPDTAKKVNNKSVVIKQVPSFNFVYIALSPGAKDSKIDLNSNIRTKAGAIIAADEVNAKGGIPALGGAKFELIFGDSQSKPDVGASETERIIQREGVTAFIGSYQRAR